MNPLGNAILGILFIGAGALATLLMYYLRGSMVSAKPPKQDGICDVCGGEVIQRDDDKAATVTRRLEVYEEQTAPLIAYYEERGLLTTVDGNAGFEETRSRLEAALGI